MLEIRGHFDGKTIVLDEPFDLKPNTQVIVKILPDEESSDWLALGKKNFAKAYADEEPEYSLDKIKEFNPEYEGS